jgi:acetyl-CoA carboxylase carboxyltransferase component
LVQRAAERGFVDDVISPRETRRRLINDLDLLKTKKPVVFEKKHGNIPL